MNLTLLSDDGTLVRLQAEGQISQNAFHDGTDPLGPLLAPVGGFARKVMINLDRATFLDSSGISWLVVSHKNFQQHGGVLVLHSVPPRIHQVLQFCRMDRLLKMADDETAAEALARGGKP